MYGLIDEKLNYAACLLVITRCLLFFSFVLVVMIICHVIICCTNVDAQVVASGPGLEKTGVVANKWAEFTVDTKLAGAPAPTHISCMDVDYKPVDVQVS